ncbi:MAG: rhodanese-like domain-containing protein [Clostridiales bacterium]|nr:rhodanese-like domain-containing protein [Clostridiales bacterium]
MELISIQQWMRNGYGRDRLLDLRPIDCYKRGHLAGAESAPWEEKGRWMMSLDRKKKIVLICYSGATAIKAAYELEAMGFHTAVIAGGYHRLGYPDCP